MKLFIAMCMLVVLSGCTPETYSTSGFIMPREMEDCTLYKMRNGSGTVLYVVHCPHADTTTTLAGKHPSRATVTY